MAKGQQQGQGAGSGSDSAQTPKPSPETPSKPQGFPTEIEKRGREPGDTETKRGS